MLLLGPEVRLAKGLLHCISLHDCSLYHVSAWGGGGFRDEQSKSCSQDRNVHLFLALPISSPPAFALCYSRCFSGVPMRSVSTGTRSYVQDQVYPMHVREERSQMSYRASPIGPNESYARPQNKVPSVLLRMSNRTKCILCTAAK
jgi:hypothetical protein